MRKRLVAILGCGLVACGCASPTVAAHGSASAPGGLTGVARLYGGPLLANGKMGLDGQPGMDIHVSVTRGSKTVAALVTGKNGSFTFALAPGRYVVKGCTTITVVVRPGQISPQDLTCPVP